MQTPFAHRNSRAVAFLPGSKRVGQLLLAAVLLVSLAWIGAARGESGPPNDHRANAASGPGAVRIDLAVPLVGSTLGATKEPGEPAHAGEPGGASVWYWILGRGQPVTLQTVGSSFDTVLAVYRSQPFGSIAETSFLKSSRSAATSGLSCSLARRVFF